MKEMLMLLLTGIVLSAHAQPAEIVLATEGRTSYSIAVHPSADSLERVAAGELSRYLSAITGASFPIVAVQPHISQKGHYIFLGSASPLAVQPKASYQIETNGNGLHIAGASSWQTLEAVYLFLEQFGGCHFLAPRAEIIPKKNEWKLAAAYRYNPVVSTRTVHSKLYFNDHLFAAKRGVSTVTFPGFVPNAGVHTFNKLVPAVQWMDKHPELFALVNGKRQSTQLCLANDTVYRLVLDSVKAWFARHPESSVLSVSQDDNTSYCTCHRCAATDAHEGSAAGSMIRFVNRIASEFPEKTISTLAYQYTRRAPKYVRPLENVLITLCSIECDRSAPISEKCKDFERDLIEWKQTGATVKIWDYTTQFTNFLAPFPNLHTLQPNVQLFVANNARWIFEQHSNNPSELFELRSYLLAQLLWNPAASYDSLYQTFMQGYYGKAAPYIGQYIETVHAEIQKTPKFFLFLYGDPAQGFNSFLREDRLTQYGEWFDAAEKAAGSDTALLARVRAARIGVDYALLEYCRRSNGPYSFQQSDLVKQVLNRFEKSTQWLQAILINEMGLRTEDYIVAYRQLATRATIPNIAAGAKVTLLTRPKKYAGENPQTLTDGLWGGWSFNANWLGFEGNHLEAIVDLGTIKSFRRMGMHFLQVSNHLVFFPDSVSFLVSDDGHDYRLVATMANPVPLTPQSRVNDIRLFETEALPINARYIKVVGSSMRTCPKWHHGAGLDAWIFADELMVTE